jgi:hypothetical protein
VPFNPDDNPQSACRECEEEMEDVIRPLPPDQDLAIAVLAETSRFLNWHVYSPYLLPNCES